MGKMVSRLCWLLFQYLIYLELQVYISELRTCKSTRNLENAFEISPKPKLNLELFSASKTVFRNQRLISCNSSISFYAWNPISSIFHNFWWVVHSLNSAVFLKKINNNGKQYKSWQHCSYVCYVFPYLVHSNPNIWRTSPIIIGLRLLIQLFMNSYLNGMITHSPVSIVHHSLKRDFLFF